MSDSTSDIIFVLLGIKCVYMRLNNHWFIFYFRFSAPLLFVRHHESLFVWRLCLVSFSDVMRTRKFPVSCPGIKTSELKDVLFSLLCRPSHPFLVHAETSSDSPSGADMIFTDADVSLLLSPLMGPSVVSLGLSCLTSTSCHYKTVMTLITQQFRALWSSSASQTHTARQLQKCVGRCIGCQSIQTLGGGVGMFLDGLGLNKGSEVAALLKVLKEN